MITLSYLKFLLKSTNHHGVHSPFVYDLVTKCFYDKTIPPTHASFSKLQRLFLRIRNYFPVKSLTDISRETPLDQSFSEPFDMVFFSHLTMQRFNQMLPTATNDSVWIFLGIHLNTENKRFWKDVKQHEQVTLTIDTFDLGLVFFRKEQQKEHFTIRV